MQQRCSEDKSQSLGRELQRQRWWEEITNKEQPGWVGLFYII
jgi:hypothetical protein